MPPSVDLGIWHFNAQGNLRRPPVSMQAGRQRGACATCHYRKVKCDISTAGIPCATCRKAGRNDCKVHQKRRRVGARSAAVPVPIAAAIDEAALGAPAPILHHGSGGGSGPTEDITLLDVQPASKAALPGFSGEECRTLLVEFVEQPSLNDRPIDRDARVTYIGTDVSNLNFLTRQRSAEQGPNVCHHPSNRIARQYIVHEPDRLPTDALQLPDKAVVDALLDCYFKHANPGFPVVDEGRFRAQYGARDPHNPPSLLLLQAMLMVGAHVAYPAPDKEAMKATFFRRAKTLFDARFERCRDEAVQAALLLTWHFDGAEDVAANAWFWTRTAATIAIGLGMHRDAEPSTLVPHNKRMWRRVFWLLFSLDVALALQYGRPQAIRLDDCDVQPLREGDFVDCGHQTQVAFTMQSVRLSIIISDAMRQRFRPNANHQERTSALVDADQRLAQWTLGLPEQLRLRPTLSLDLYASMLHLSYNTFLILLHRPRPPGSTVHDVMKPEDADICSAAASHVQSLADALRERDMLKYLPNSTVHVLFTAMIQLSVEVRFANPVLAIAAQRRFDSILASMRSLANVWPQADPILYYFEHLSKRRQQEEQAMLEGASSNGIGLDHAQNEAFAGAELGAHGVVFDHTGAETENALLQGGDWQHLFQDGMIDMQDYSAGLPDWDEWRTHYWEGPSYESLSPEFNFIT
ncbi:hypothetical protein LTR85_004779 [Meristemomyces frigidus]|nr:hypothetical protein LTR85_004779 [Meristemomyces frigidus]